VNRWLCDAPLRGDVARRPNALERIATDASSARDVSAASTRRSNAASQRSTDERRGCGALKKKSCAFENLNGAASRDDTRHVGADATKTRAKRSATVRTGTRRVRARVRAVTASILNFVAMAHRRIRAHHAARARRADLRASRSRASPRVFARSRSRAVERPRDARGRVATEPHTGRSTRTDVSRTRDALDRHCVTRDRIDFGDDVEAEWCPSLERCVPLDARVRRRVRRARRGAGHRSGSISRKTARGRDRCALRPMRARIGVARRSEARLLHVSCPRVRAVPRGRTTATRAGVRAAAEDDKTLGAARAVRLRGVTNFRANLICSY